MADTSNAQLTFRSWLRRGLATQQKLLNASDPRATVKIRRCHRRNCYAALGEPWPCTGRVM